MGQIFTMTENQSKEYIKFDIPEDDFNFLKAKQLAKKTAFEKCDYPMILSYIGAFPLQTDMALFVN